MHRLVETLAGRLRGFARLLHDGFIDGQGDIHPFLPHGCYEHRLCVKVDGVKGVEEQGVVGACGGGWVLGDGGVVESGGEQPPAPPLQGV